MTQPTPKPESDRRTEPRYRMNRPGVLRSRYEDSVAVQVVDLSASGVRLFLPCRLPLDAKVQIEFEEAIVSGWVRHCQALGAAAFSLGIWVPECRLVEEASLSPYELPVHRNGLELL